MTHISSKRLKKGVATELADEFITFLTAAQTRRDARALANELLSQTERVMLVKRLAIVVLLVRGYSFTQIADTLGVTRQTIVRVWRSTKDGHYDKIAAYARKYTAHFKHQTAIYTFINALHIVAPPRLGKGRWRSLGSLAE
ncbi:hypothetical protein COU19_02295 [Candidatus Kaiserbacteria bacterium CG10_big_fil_rev_8_21_14_0_10_56_12]|uniref:Uncharacterized protein n=1 Tax=Candidatus Kaiserbacteria bacterium CG10_big_fil_rev_8_21_14_0_10_56_12 TaxID=1974611 RepID=A0A2H0U9L2_9BACT|nr:MAG: hypothetical protein COU19_02295 [Candidatus Kaiserbacteria bacterium CG10_big_fil_rev_8_21_14_0_10_56_12]